MDEAPKKGNPSLSIDRAAFLLLRVKKAFKKKRQQRKDKLAAQQAAAGALASQTRAYKRGGPPPLLRSRTLPAIVVPGISILQAQIDPTRLSTADSAGSVSSYSARWSLQPKSSRASLVSDDSSLEIRRKSSGSTHSGPPLTNNNNAEPYIYVCDDYERHPDGSVVLRIPAPHVVAARAYRVSAGSSTFSGPAGIFTPPPQQTSGATPGCSTTTTSSTPLYRLARLLNQSTKTGRESPVLKDDAPRRLSWERRDNQNNRIPRSASIDSMVEAVWNDTPRPSLNVPIDASLQQSVSQHYMQHQHTYQLTANFGSFSGSSSSRRESLLSPSTGRRTKQNRGITDL